jgi:hypothetical protein
MRSFSKNAEWKRERQRFVTAVVLARERLRHKST